MRTSGIGLLYSCKPFNLTDFTEITMEESVPGTVLDCSLVIGGLKIPVL
jgi:hypothetical protein